MRQLHILPDHQELYATQHTHVPHFSLLTTHTSKQRNGAHITGSLLNRTRDFSRLRTCKQTIPMFDKRDRELLECTTKGT